MVHLVTADQMRQIEQRTFDTGVKPADLMSAAGRVVAGEILVRLPRAESARALVLVGPGNNGGDGLVVADTLRQHGLAQVQVWLFQRDGLGDAPVEKNLLRQVPVIRADDDGGALRAALAESDVIVDAIFGIGARDTLPDSLLASLDEINARGREPGVLLVAVDVPTGVNADTGAVAGRAFEADLTVTLGLPKQGLFQPPGMRAAGEIIVAPLNLAEVDLPAETPQLLDRAAALARLPRRAADAHKGDAGSLLVIGGSFNYLGAPVLTAHAALRAGVGLLTLALPRGLVPICAPQVPEATYLPLAEADWGIVRRDAVLTVTDALERYSALLVGNGLGRHEPTDEFLAYLFGLATVTSHRERPGFVIATAVAEAEQRAVTVPVLFDADGLNWLSTIDRWWQHLADLQLILTPHHGELARLRNVPREEISAAPWQAARDAAREWGQVVVLKGGYTVVALPDGALWVAPRANPALAAAGTGDTLAGLLAGFLAQGLSTADAAILGLWVATEAAQEARAAVGTLPLLASDLPAYIARVIRELEMNAGPGGNQGRQVDV